METNGRPRRKHIPQREHRIHFLETARDLAIVHRGTALFLPATVGGLLDATDAPKKAFYREWPNRTEFYKDVAESLGSEVIHTGVVLGEPTTDTPRSQMSVHTIVESLRDLDPTKMAHVIGELTTILAKKATEQ